MSDLYLHFAAEAPKGVYVAKVSKVLHLKLPGLFPLLDSHVQDRYRLEAKALRHIHPELGWRRRTWVAVRRDLIAARSGGGLDQLRARVRAFEAEDPAAQERVRCLDAVTDLRLLDMLTW